MNRKGTTAFLSKLLVEQRLSGMGKYWANEVTLDYGSEHPKRVDFMQFVPPRTIFVCSMADLFGDWVPDKWIEEVFKACEKAPQHHYLFLTKNPERYKKLADKGKLPQKDNLWYGSTITNKKMKAFSSLNYNTFVSVEPLFEPVNLCDASCVNPNWVIIGAETGNRKDKILPQKEWIDDITAYCDLCKIPVFMKDSLIPIVGEENMRREFPWERSSK